MYTRVCCSASRASVSTHGGHCYLLPHAVPCVPLPASRATAVACSPFGPWTHDTYYCAGHGTEEKHVDDDDKEEEGMSYEEKGEVR